MGFSNIGQMVDAEQAGKLKYAGFRKAPAVVTVAGTWLDYSMIPGTPPPQYYAATPLVAQTLSSADGGIAHGGNVTPSTKYLRRLTAMATGAGGVPQRILLLDYLMFYPFCDMGSADSQEMDNTQILLRHTTGDGVKMMAVLVAPHSLAGDTFTVTYTNELGQPGRITPSHTMTTGAAVNATILTTQSAGAGRIGPFMVLQGKDNGVRSIESVQCTNGFDVGLFTMVLVYPLADFMVREITAPVEKDWFTDAGAAVPAIVDGAYLNFISCPSGSVTGVPLFGDVSFVWT